MTLKLKRTTDSPPPFNWDALVPSPPPYDLPELSTSPPTSWLSARDMKMFGAQPLRSDIGIVKCNLCDKPVLRSAIAEHAGEYIHTTCRLSYIYGPDHCKLIRSGGKKGSKAKSTDVEGTVVPHA
jgi:SAGA-associated factor 73